MDNKDYLSQLQEIQQIMNRSTRFLSLSGLSGILAGCYALIGAYSVHIIVANFFYAGNYSQEARTGGLIKIFGIAIAILLLSIVTGLYFSQKKAHKNNEKLWNKTSIRFALNFFIPLTTGGAFGIILLLQENYDLIAPVMLLFYGLSLINASRYSLETLRSLAFVFIILGLINAIYPKYGLYFWALGFGVAHIVYGIYMYYKFDRK